MKKILCSVLVILSFMLLMPLAAIKKSTAVSAMNINTSEKIPKAADAVSDSFKVCNTENGEVTEMKAEDYIIGVVSAEMPALYEAEALKAQAVAAYTYACYRRAENSEKSYDITNDHTTDQSFSDKTASAARWGDKADEYYEKIRSAVREVSGFMVTYDGKPALTVYHAISSGKTESCLNVWGRDIPYLRPADSSGDRLSPDYISKLTLSSGELREKLSSECEISEDASGWFGEPKRTDSGMVSEISVCGSTVKGARIRSLLGLRSSDFEVAYSDGSFTFTVYGYGHGVGMSQYGANYLAKQGSDFKEILLNYYSVCKIEKIS